MWRAGGVLAVLGVLLVRARAPRAGAAPVTAYIVQLAAPPLASYRGGITGLAATNPATIGARKLDPSSAASKAYLNYLAQRQAPFTTSLAQTLGRAVTATISYKYAFNGLYVH